MKKLWFLLMILGMSLTFSCDSDENDGPDTDDMHTVTDDTADDTADDSHEDGHGEDGEDSHEDGHGEDDDDSHGEDGHGDDGDAGSNYSISIMSPDAEDKKKGDEIHLHVNFEEVNMGTVHHVNVRIYNKADGTEIYSEPTEAHVHEEDGLYEWHDDIKLDVEGHTDWILEAKVWGHDDLEGELTKSIEFHVHPN